MSSPGGAKRANDAASPDGKEPAAKRFRPSYSNDTIKVLVGPSEEEFGVHKDIIRAKSPFFEAACKEDWSEGKAGTVRLPGHPANAFRLFAHWIYTSTIDLEIITTQAAKRQVACLVDAWVLGDFLGCFDFCNKAMDSALQDIYARQSLLPHFNTVAKTPADSGIRRLLVDHMAFNASVTHLDKYGASYPIEFILEVTKVLYNRGIRPNFNPLQQDKCYYHKHPEGTPKCA